MKPLISALSLGVTGLLTLTSPATAKPTQITNELVLKLRFSNQANMPQSSKLAQKVLGDEVDVSTFSEKLDIDGKSYRLNADIPMPRPVALASSLDRVRRYSEGDLTATGLMGTRILEQRGAKADIYEARLTKDRKQVEFLKNKRKVGSEAVAAPVTDLASLPYFWMGRAVKAQSTTMDVIDARRAYKRQTFQAKALDIQYLGQNIKAVQFTKVKKSAQDSELVILVRQSDGMPLRIDLGLSGKYGLSALVYPKVIPSPVNLALR